MIKQQKFAHISPSMTQVYQFLQKEQEKYPGFKFITNEVFTKQLKNVDNLRLTALLTVDFEDYVRCATRA